MRPFALLLAAVVACCPPLAKPADTVATDEPVLPAEPDPGPELPAEAPPPDPAPPSNKPPYPATRRDNVVDTLHGTRVADPYRWLEDEHQPEVKAWMDEQDAFARARLTTLPRRDELAARLREVFYYDALGAPTHRKGRYFYTRKHADKEKTIVYVRAGKRGGERVLLDPNTWSTDGSAGLGGWWPSRDGKYVAFGKKLNNSDEAVMHVIDASTGKETTDVIPGTKYGGASWTPDSKGFYYTWVPPVGGKVTIADRPGFAELRYHKLGSDPSKDPVVRPATGNPQTFLGGGVSWDGRWLFAIVQHGWNSSDVYFKDLKKGDTEWTTLVEGQGAIFQVIAWRDQFYVLTNHEAPRYRVFKVDPKSPARA
jgi:prolyl oligopeptidase